MLHFECVMRWVNDTNMLSLPCSWPSKANWRTSIESDRLCVLMLGEKMTGFRKNEKVRLFIHLFIYSTIPDLGTAALLWPTWLILTGSQHLEHRRSQFDCLSLCLAGCLAGWQLICRLWPPSLFCGCREVMCGFCAVWKYEKPSKQHRPRWVNADRPPADVCSAAGKRSM